MNRRALLLIVMAVWMMATVGAAAAMAQDPMAGGGGSTQQAPTAASDTITVPLVPVGGSGVRGVVALREASTGGTQIAVEARGLQPGNRYVSLYYENHTCALEPYSQDDIIGGRYTANSNGIGHTSGTVDDALADINSVSVRSAANFKLLACADVHPA